VEPEEIAGELLGRGVLKGSVDWVIKKETSWGEIVRVAAGRGEDSKEINAEIKQFRLSGEGTFKPLIQRGIRLKKNGNQAVGVPMGGKIDTN